ncbi:MAG: PIG-L family deacetylase [bacterium]
MKIGVYVAHDDDAILGVGGRIVQHIKSEDSVYIVIFTDGRHSHKAVLGIINRPTPSQLKTTRRQEMLSACTVLGVPKNRIYFLNQIDGDGGTWKESAKLRKVVAKISDNEKPDIIYFHHADAHPDHQAVNQLMTKIVKGPKKQVAALQFFIWTKDKAVGRLEVSQKNMPLIPLRAIRINIEKEKAIKRRALYKMKSQVYKKPYSDWHKQSQPILDRKFISYFLNGEELFVK